VSSASAAEKVKSEPAEAGKPQNIEYRTPKETNRGGLTSSFEIPCSIFDIRVSQFVFGLSHPFQKAKLKIDVLFKVSHGT
jgi:hypothetical protein